MADLRDLLQCADWKTEKHVPVIEVSDKINKGQVFEVKVSVGKQIAHPNTTEHHISWATAFFLPDGEKFAYQIARAEFSAHGESAQGPNTSTVYSNPEFTTVFKTEKSGTIFASSYCNIHGLWQSSKSIDVK